MSAISYYNGNPIFWRLGGWEYEDSTKMEFEPKPCPRCGGLPSSTGEDACLGRLDGCIYACCGHGIIDPFFVYHDNGELVVQE